MLTHDELLERVSEYISSECDCESCGFINGPYKALRAVVELHKPTDDGLGCSYEFIECHDETGLGCDIPRTCNQYKPYPCSTIKAIEKELA
jgi:hypothetical protein